MAMTLHTSFAIAILSAALAFGGLSVAAAHHGDISEHSTTKGKSLAQIERLERQITAELNRKQLMPQVAAVQTPAAPAPIPQQQAPMPEQQPIPNEPPAAPQPDDQAALPRAESGDIAAAQEEGAEATN